MSNCGNCGGQQICTCSFIDGINAEVTGSGRVTRPINYRPTNVPLPRPYGLLINIGTQLIPGLTAAPISFNRNQSMFEGGMASTVPATKLTAPIAGYYLTAAFCNSDTNEGVAVIAKNGFTIGVGTGTQTVLAGHPAGGRSLMTLLALNAGDYLELWYTAPAADTNIGLNDQRISSGLPGNYAYLWAQWMRPL